MTRKRTDGRFLGLSAVAACALALLVQAPAHAAPPGHFELLGHDPLLNRGMNAALAVYGNYAYIGSRTDGSHLDSEVLVVDVKDPTKPAVVGRIGLPNEANLGESSRELRVLPQQQLLMVLNHGCSELIHRCINGASAGVNIVKTSIRFYDIAGANSAAPKLVGTYFPSRSEAQTPHELFVWNDPKRPGRVLLYETTPGSGDQLLIADISHARENKFEEIGAWEGGALEVGSDSRLHSLTVSDDGRRAFLAQLTGGFGIADLSDFADAKADPKVRSITPNDNTAHWDGPGDHSSVQIPGTHYAMTTDEVYGAFFGVLAGHGCPWGWARIIDIADPAKPQVVAEYKLPYNDPAYCTSVAVDRQNLASFASHNPTLFPDLAFVTWHSGGLQAIDLADPTHPTQAAEYLPDPLPFVQTEDPVLSSGRDKVVMWSFPIVKDGLVYVVDLRNGLYILRYHGPHEDEVARTRFLDGNSNSGDRGPFEAINKPAKKRPTTAARLRSGCLAGPLRLGLRTLGPFVLGQSRKDVALRAGPARSRSASVSVYCVGRTGRAAAVFSARGRVVLVAAQVPGAGVSAGDSLRQARRSVHGLRSLGAGLYAVRSRVLVVRHGRVITVAVADRGALRSAAALRAALRKADAL